MTHETLQQKRQELCLPAGPLVLFAGRLTREKGIHLLVKAWERASPATDAALILVGDGLERAWIENRIRHSGQNNNIYLVGWQDDPRPIFQLADIFAFPSEADTFANVLAEAMASRLAIVSTSVGLAASAIEHGRNALVAPHDIDAFAAMLSELLRDHALRERLGKAAQEDAKQMFGELETKRAYRRLLGVGVAGTTA